VKQTRDLNPQTQNPPSYVKIADNWQHITYIVTWKGSRSWKRFAKNLDEAARTARWTRTKRWPAYSLTSQLETLKGSHNDARSKVEALQIRFELHSLCKLLF